MEYKGYGETQPISSDNCEEDHQRNRRTQIAILNNQLFFYQKLLQKDSIIQSHYFEHLDYFEFNKANFQEEFDSVASYFKQVLEQDSTLLLTIENHIDARGSQYYSQHIPNEVLHHLTQNHQLDIDKVRMNGFYINTKGYLYSINTIEKVLIRFTSKAEYEDDRSTTIKTIDKCKNCPF